MNVGTIIDWDPSTWTSGKEHLLLYIGAPAFDSLNLREYVRALRPQIQHLYPRLRGVIFHEEWYGALKRGQFASYGLCGCNPHTLKDEVDIVRWWVGEQHRILKEELNLPTIFLEQWINADVQWGPWWYQPPPPYTDVWMLDAYIPNGGSFTNNVMPLYEQSLRSTVGPIILTPMWFRVPGDIHWNDGPSPQDIEGYALYMQHPRVVGMVGFTWESRQGMIGLDRMTTIRQVVRQSLGR